MIDGPEDSFLKEIRNYLMNEVFGIDPNTKFELKELQVLLNTFGFKYGRFIGAYPADDWLNIIKNNTKVSGFDESRLISILEKARDGIIPIKDQYRISNDYPNEWIENSINIKIKNSIFNQIFSNNGEKYNLPSIDDLLLNEKYDPTLSIGDYIPATSKSYCDAIYPLLLKSTEIHIADQYFELWNQSGIDRRKWEVLRSIFEMAHRSERCTKIYLHLNIKSITQNLENLLIQYLRDIRSESKFSELSVAFSIHKNMSHGRYIFSIKGGLQFDYGLEINRRYPTNHVHWLSKKELDPLFDTYVEKRNFKII